MIHQEQDNGLNGLTGWFSNFFGGFSSVFTSQTSDDSQNSSGGIIGRRIGNFLNRILSLAGFSGKTNAYAPTPQELLILNPLKTALNNYMIALVKAIDNFFNANTNTQARIDYLNNAIRKIQIVQTYFSLNNHPALSVNAQQYLSDAIITMINAFEITIEELLDNNAIAYIKTEGALAVNTADTYPVGINIPANELGHGYQYKVANTETAVISTNVPTVSGNATVPTPKPAVVTDVVAGGKDDDKSKTSNGMVIAVVLFAIAAILVTFSPKETKKQINK